MMKPLDSIMMWTDSYKVGHWPQYPPGSEIIRSYFESRGGLYSSTVFFGLQYYLQEYLTRQFTQEHIDAADKFWTKHGMTFNRAGWESMLKKHNGYLPVSIRAVAEGSVIPTSNVLMTVENTDPEFYWLTNWLETLLVKVWYPSTVATQSREMKKVYKRYLDETGDPAGIDFKVHDFGYRGVSSEETAGLGSSGHLLSFLGTDTIAGPILLAEHYGADMAGFSINASEHSTITSWGRDNELAAQHNMLDQYPTGLVASVSDSYNIFEMCKAWSSEPLRSRVLGRDGTLVIRPDSGTPTTVIIDCLNILMEGFGELTNDKGYRVLPEQVRMIQGDGIDPAMQEKILSHMKHHGFSADNLAMGSGGGLLQKMDRDTCKYAFKASEIVIDGVAKPVYKDPVTDPGKTSKQGNLHLLKEKATGKISTLCDTDPLKVVIDTDKYETLLVEVFRNGKILKTYDLDEIRERAAI